jgi:gamma-glutamylcyclotransferase (GGCT)/AIG2-like uncharacterized protein YtfP
MLKHKLNQTLNMHKVFVYGSLLSGMGNHRLLEKSKKLGLSHSPKGFGMIDLGYFPGAIRLDGTENRIIGEVYEVDDYTLARIDGLEGYRPSQPDRGLYNRLEIDTDFGKAFIYIFNIRRDQPSTIIEKGDWRSYFNQKVYKYHQERDTE